MKPIYLDHAATTFPTKKTQKLMQKLKKKYWANASSAHTAGIEAAMVLKQARNDFAEMIHARSQDCIFARGGTEAVIVPIQSALKEWKKQNEGVIPTVYISPLEHSAVKEYITQLDEDGEIHGYVLDIDETGKIDQKALLQALNETTALVSIQQVNNETGLIQNSKETAKTIRRFKKDWHQDKNAMFPLLHVDAAQAWGWVSDDEMDVRKLNADSISWGASKWGGSKSIGITWLKPTFPRNGLWFNGSHEFGMRPGTVDVPAVAASVFAAQERLQKRQAKNDKISTLQTWFISELKNSFKENIQINTSKKAITGEGYVASIVSVSFAYVSGERLAIELNASNIYVGFGAACSSQSGSASHVLDSLGLLNEPFHLGALRLSFDFCTTESELKKSLAALERIYKKVLLEHETGSDIML